MSVWIVTAASSSNEDFGPELIALEVDAELLRAVRVLRRQAGELVTELEGYGRITWFCARIALLDAPEEFGALPESGYQVLPDAQLQELLASVPDDWQAELCAITVFSVIADTNAIYAQAAIEHTSVRVESMISLADAFKEIENGLHYTLPE